MLRPVQGSKLYVLLLMAFVLSSLVGSVTYWARGQERPFATCNPEGADDSNFVAGCTSHLFGDYEHGALFFGLEPEAIAHLRRAQVLVLGNSSAMFAFSTRATEDAFRELGARFYVMGFGYGELSRFPLAMIRKYDLRPQAIIINADPFFGDSTHFQNVVNGEVGTYFRYRLQKYFQRAQKMLCTRPSSGDFFCSKERTIYRSIADGRWELEKYVTNPNRFPVVAGPDVQLGDFANRRKVARSFREQIRLADKCIVITNVPTDAPTSEFAKSVAADINATYLASPFDGYHTIDHIHLAREDAERWSTEFLGRVMNTLRDCVPGLSAPN
jgi:hypothetical protein